MMATVRRKCLQDCEAEFRIRCWLMGLERRWRPLMCHAYEELGENQDPIRYREQRLDTGSIKKVE